MIGSIVTVIVDRPLGSVHPEYPELCYPVNYGYVDGVFASDGEAQDAYILGVEKPVEIFTGQIIAIIHRKDDIEDKWIVAPGNLNISKEEIWEAVQFQEQYFDSEILI